MTNHIFTALLEALTEEYGNITHAQIASALGVSTGSISNWKNGGTPSKKNLKKLIELFRDHHAAYLVKPILEYKLFSPTKVGNEWRLGSTSEETKELKEKLEKKKGIYIFYDSSGCAIYLGKTESSLYLEAKQRLKAVPDRPIYLPTRAKVGVMGDRARFLSAYEVTIPAAIKNLESFMLRAFSNDLRNKNGGNFYTSI